MIHTTPDRAADNNKLQPADQPIHAWYRFVLSYPPHLVREYLARFNITSKSTVLDPFCGTGTTLVECKKAGIPGVGVEANPVAYFASTIKTNWTPNPDALLDHARSIAAAALDQLAADRIEDNPALLITHPLLKLKTLPDASQKLLLRNSISPLPLHKVLILLETLDHDPTQDARFAAHERLALAQVLVTTASNLRFGPEVGLGAIKHDAPVITAWLDAVRRMAHDLRQVNGGQHAPTTLYQADARDLSSTLAAGSIDAVITSPPYPNEKDYTRTTRLESVILGFFHDKADLQALKRTLIRSNTRNVYSTDRDDSWITAHPAINALADQIEARRIELGKTSGFERLYARVTRLYFGGMAQHLAELRPILRPGAQLAYVVGDQASYFQVMIRTGQLLAEIAQALGYEVQSIDLFRTRLSTTTKAQLREEVVVLRWPGIQHWPGVQ